MNKLKILMETKQTVFNYEEIKAIFSWIAKNTLEKSLSRSKKTWELLNPYKGIWTLPVYDEKELACKLKKGSYISLESVLYDVGAILQSYFYTKTCIAKTSADLTINNINYRYIKMKDSLLLNDLYVKQYENYRIATPERALCDYIYLFPKSGLDAPEVFRNPNSKAKLQKLLPFYPKTTQKIIRNLLNGSDF